MKLSIISSFLGSVILAVFTTTSLFAEQTGKGRRLLAADDSKGVVAIIGADGKTEWQHKCGPIHDSWVLPSGNVLTQLSWTRVVELSPADNKIVWEYEAKKSHPNTAVEIHAFQPVEEGKVMIVESGPGRIIEVSRDGKIEKEIKLKVDHPHPHKDTRLVRKLPTGNYLVAHEGDGWVREYDGVGKIVWDYEVPLFGRAVAGGHGPESFGNSVFSAMRLDNGNTLIGTGNGHSVVEVTPAKEIVWKVEQKDLPGITLAWVCRVLRLPNGNTFINNCHAGPDQPQGIEITPDKKVVWTWKDFTTFGNSTPVLVPLDEVKK